LEKLMKNGFRLLILAFSFLMMVGLAAANPIKVELTYSNIESWDSIPLFATVTLKPVNSPSGVHVDVDFAKDMYGIFGFGFNTTGNDPDTLTVQNVTTGWTLKSKSDENLGNWGGFGDAGKFEYAFDGPNTPGAVSEFSFDIVGLSPESLLEENSKGWLFAAHITYQGVTGNIWGNNDPKTPQDSSPVPEPATFMLLGSGILGIALWSRRKK
jgi:hypothetical protein